MQLPAADSAGSEGRRKGSPPRVLIVTASTRRRGAELEATQLAAELRCRGVPVTAAALTGAGDGVALPLDVLGRHRLGPGTLWRLRKAARRADVVIAYGSSTLPACVVALTGSSMGFVYRNISDPAYWVRNRLHRGVTGLQYRRAAADRRPVVRGGGIDSAALPRAAGTGHRDPECSGSARSFALLRRTSASGPGRLSGLTTDPPSPSSAR